VPGAAIPADQGAAFTVGLLQVVYGVDYLVVEAANRLTALRNEVVDHLNTASDALLVVSVTTGTSMS